MTTETTKKTRKTNYVGKFVTDAGIMIVSQDAAKKGLSYDSVATRLKSWKTNQKELYGRKFGENTIDMVTVSFSEPGVTLFEHLSLEEIANQFSTVCGQLRQQYKTSLIEDNEFTEEEATNAMKEYLPTLGKRGKQADPRRKKVLAGIVSKFKRVEMSKAN